MKKSCLLLAVVMLPLSLLMSCGSTAKFDLRTSEPVALITVTCNGNLPWKEVETANGVEESSDSAGLLSSIMAKNSSDNPETNSINSRIDYSAEIFEDMLSAAGLSVLKHSDVASGSVYSSLLGGTFNLGNTDVGAEGYLKGKPNLDKSRKILKESGAKSLICTSFVFKKDKIKLGVFGRGVKAYVKMTVSVIGESGRVEAKKVYECTSDTYVEYDNGSWDKKAVVDLFPETVEKAVGLFIKDFVSELPVEKAVVNSEADINENTSVESDSSDEYVYDGEATVITLPVMGERKASE